VTCQAGENGIGDRRKCKTSVKPVFWLFEAAGVRYSRR
jgi:hypothetical protein